MWSHMQWKHKAQAVKRGTCSEDHPVLDERAHLLPELWVCKRRKAVFQHKKARLSLRCCCLSADFGCQGPATPQDVLVPGYRWGNGQDKIGRGATWVH